MRVTVEHWNILLDFAELHPEIITNKFVGLSGRQHNANLWENITHTLNSLGYGEKTTEGWKKTLADWKSKTKAKNAKIRQYQFKTGGGGSCTSVLSSNEERLLQLMGTTAIDGDGNVREFGIQITDSQNLNSMVEKENTQASSSSIDVLKNCGIYQSTSKPLIAEASSREPNFNNNENSFNKYEANPVSQDMVVKDNKLQEKILPNNPRKRPVNTMPTTTNKKGKPEILANKIEAMNETTINVLKNIEGHLNRIANAVEKVADHIDDN